MNMRRRVTSTFSLLPSHQVRVDALDAVLEHVRHRDELVPAPGGGQRVGGGAGAAAAAADQGEADGVVFGGEDVRDVHARQRRNGGDGGTLLKKRAAVDLLTHHVLMPVCVRKSFEEPS